MIDEITKRLEALMKDQDAIDRLAKTIAGDSVNPDMRRNLTRGAIRAIIKELNK